MSCLDKVKCGWQIMFNSPQRTGQNQRARKRNMYTKDSGLDYKTGGRGQQGKEDTEKNGVHTTLRKHTEPQNGSYFEQKKPTQFQHFGSNADELVALHRYKDNINSSKIHNLDHTNSTEFRIINNNRT